jgi:uncharacterized protein YbjT (DUF2867 family)
MRATVDDHAWIVAEQLWKVSRIAGSLLAMTSADLTLVTGGTGKTGRRVADRLQARGRAVRIGSRSGAPPFDWEDRDTWPAALEGATSAYISFYPDLAVPGSVDAVAALADVALAAGCRRLVLLSGRGEPEAQAAERALQDSGADWTVVRCSWFDQNFSESFFLEPLLAGELALPVDGVAEPFVDADDIADVAVAALTEDGHARRLYELTGPRLLRFDEAVAEIAAASGREIRYVPITLEQFVEGLKADGLPPDVTALLAFLFGEVLDGRNASPADGVQQALGRPARDFREFARAEAARGTWTR